MIDTIGDLLKDQERILIAAWVLPNEGTLTETQRRQAMDNFTRYLRHHGLTPTQVAHQLGRPHATKIKMRSWSFNRSLIVSITTDPPVRHRGRCPLYRWD